MKFFKGNYRIAKWVWGVEGTYCEQKSAGIAGDTVISFLMCIRRDVIMSPVAQGH